MTPPVGDPNVLREILATTEALLLDFDGPICSVFAGFPAHEVAEQLRAVLADGGHTDLPPGVEQAADPFIVLLHAAKLGPDPAFHVEAAFRAHEVEAVQSARSTPDTTELMRAWKERGRKLAIVSNNSAAAVNSYLDIHNIRSRVDYVSARADAEVARLKPNPSMLLDALRVLNVSPDRSALVGDSLSDAEAAKAAEVRAIMYANKPNKQQAALRFVRSGAVVESMHALLEALS